VRLLTTQEALALDAKEFSAKLGFGIYAKTMPVYGYYGVIHVNDYSQHQPRSAKSLADLKPGAAKAAGLKNGDLLLAVDHQSIKGIGDSALFQYIAQRSDPITFTIMRDEKVFDVVVHPNAERLQNYGLDMSLSFGDPQSKVLVFAESAGPAKQAGILSADEVETINGQPAGSLSEDDLTALGGHCKLGDQLRLKPLRLDHEVTIPCGLATSAYGYSFQGGGSWMVKSNKDYLLQLRIPDMNDSRVVDPIDGLLMGASSRAQAVIDLRGTTGTDLKLAAKIASHLRYNGGTFACEVEGGVKGRSFCYAVRHGGVLEVNDHGKYVRPMTERTDSNHRAVGGVVIIDDKTGGTSLLLASFLQRAHFRVITSGKAVVSLGSFIKHEPLMGDPQGRYLQYPMYRLHSDATGTSELKVDEVVPAGKEYERASTFLGVQLKLWDPKAFHNFGEFDDD